MPLPLRSERPEKALLGGVPVKHRNVRREILRLPFERSGNGVRLFIGNNQAFSQRSPSHVTTVVPRRFNPDYHTKENFAFIHHAIVHSEVMDRPNGTQQRRQTLNAKRANRTPMHAAHQRAVGTPNPDPPGAAPGRHAKFFLTFGGLASLDRLVEKQGKGTAALSVRPGKPGTPRQTQPCKLRRAIAPSELYWKMEDAPTPDGKCSRCGPGSHPGESSCQTSTVEGQGQSHRARPGGREHCGS